MDPELHKAAEVGNWNVIQQFEDVLDIYETPNKDTVVHVLSQFCDSWFAIEQILKGKPELLLKLNAQKETALHIAARKGHSNVVRAVMDFIKSEEKYRSVLKYRNAYGNLALHEAIKNNRHEIVQLLFDDPSLKDIMKQENESLLYLAVEKGDEDLVNLILSTYDWASRSFIKVCLSILSEAVGLRGLRGKNALHAAAIRNFPGTTFLLIQLLPENNAVGQYFY